MNVTVNPGHCVVANSASAVYGAYRFGNLSQATLTVATSDPTNARIDLVVAHVQDNGDATSYCEIALVTGTPAPIPAAPSLPANAMTLAQISVPAGASSIVAGNISDQRVWTVPPGGILPVSSASAAPAGQNGMYTHALDTGRLLHTGAAGPKQPVLLPFTPVTASSTSDKISTGAETAVLSVSITTDGSTDVEIHYAWFAVRDQGTSTNPIINVHQRIYIDSTLVSTLAVAPILNTNSQGGPGGGSGWYRTMASLGTTPSAGTHTIAWKFIPFSGGTDPIHLQANSAAPLIMEVKPVCA